MNLALKNNRDKIWVFLISISFILLNAFMISGEFYFLSLVPLVLLVVLLAVYSLDNILLMVVFFTPFSIELSEFVTGLPIDVHLPTEPLLLAILFVVIIKYVQGHGFDRKIIWHPVSIAIYFNLLWLFITTLTSSMPMVSIKFLLARIWFLVAFYFLATQFFKNYRNISRYFWMYTIPLMAVIFIILVKLSAFGFFNQHAAHFLVQPFFTDHTSYGAILAIILPVVTGFLFSDQGTPFYLRIWYLLAFAVILIAVVLSYTRAAWVSLAGVLIVFIIIRLQIRFSFLLIASILLGLFIFSYRTEIVLKLEQNRQDSSKELGEHIKSISNVSTDASNLERLNRWSCAWRMFKEKPVLGWGPGTYMFQYTPFQISRERTEISTNFSNMGNAHSEYIGPLAESGFIGTLSFTWVVIAVIITGLRVYKNSSRGFRRILPLTILLGLMTYYLHGFLNNFLDTDKASALFWGFAAMLVAMDIYHTREQGKSPGPVQDN